jgi:hypothetical protein
MFLLTSLSWLLGTIFVITFTAAMLVAVVKPDHAVAAATWISARLQSLADVLQVLAWKTRALAVAISDAAESYRTTFNRLSGQGPAAIEFGHTE